MVWNAWEIVSSWDRAEKASKRPFSGLVSISPGNSRYNETQNPENWIFLDSRKSAQMLVKTSQKCAFWAEKSIFYGPPYGADFWRKTRISAKFSEFYFTPIFTFHHKFPHFDGKSDFREKRQISTLPADFRDFCMSRIFPRSGQGVTLGQGHFFKVWNYRSPEWPLGALFEKFWKT